MKKKTIILMAATMAFPLWAGAQEQMDLRSCMEYAVEHSSQMKIQTTALQDAQVNHREAWVGAFTPRLEAGTYLYSNFGRTVDPETNTYISSTSLNNGYSAGGSFVLFNGFKAVNGIRISKTALRMGHSKEQQITDEICLAVMQAYYNVVFCSQMSRVLESFVENARKNLELVLRQQELGQKGRGDVVQLQAELADREFEYTDMENHRKEALLTLKGLMLWPVAQELPLELDLQDLHLSQQDSQYPDSLVPGPQLAESAAAWLPAAQLARGNVETARLNWQTERWNLAPRLSLSGGWSTSYYTYPGKAGYEPAAYGSQIRNNGGEYVQLNLSIPIFNGGSRLARIARARNAYRRSCHEYEQTMQQIGQEVELALQERDGAYAALEQARKRAAVQEEAYQLNCRKMAYGLISSIEFQSASNLYLKARAECLDAQLKYRLKHSVVQFYEGVGYLEQ